MKISKLVLICLLVTALPAFSADLATYKKTYDKALEDIVLSNALTLTKLRKSYESSLEKLKKQVIAKGDLDKVSAVMEEQKRFSDEKKVTDDDIKNSDDDIRKLQEAYVGSFNSLRYDRAKKIVSLTQKYDKSLAKLQIGYTKQSKLDEAFAVKDERKIVAGSKVVIDANSLLDDSVKKDKKQAAKKTSQSSKSTSKAAFLENRKSLSKSKLIDSDKKIRRIELSKAELFKQKHMKTSDKEWTLLVDLDPVTATVGYGSFVRHKKGATAFGIAKKPFETALQAHADSSIVYDLGGQYEEFSVSYGMKTGCGGSAVFFVIVDGKEKLKTGGIWSYGGTRATGHKPVRIDVGGASKLELKTVGVRGGAGAWSAWGDPKIR